jgi:hypothetical protein
LAGGRSHAARAKLMRRALAPCRAAKWRIRATTPSRLDLLKNNEKTSTLADTKKLGTPFAPGAIPEFQFPECTDLRSRVKVGMQADAKRLLWPPPLFAAPMVVAATIFLLIGSVRLFVPKAAPRAGVNRAHAVCECISESRPSHPLQESGHTLRAGGNLLEGVGRTGREKSKWRTTGRWSVSPSAQVRGGVSRPYSPGRRESRPAFSASPCLGELSP